MWSWINAMVEREKKREEDGEFVNRLEKQRSCKALVLLQSLFRGPTMQIQGEKCYSSFKDPIKLIVV